MSDVLEKFTSLYFLFESVPNKRYPRKALRYLYDPGKLHRYILQKMDDPSYVITIRANVFFVVVKISQRIQFVYYSVLNNIIHISVEEILAVFTSVSP